MNSARTYNGPNVIETEWATFSLREDGILLIEMKDDVDISIEAVKDMHVAMLKVIGEGDCLMLVRSGTGASATPEAREYAASYKAKLGVIAEAIIVNNLAHRLLANVYIKFNKPRKPTRMFADEEEAVAWLKSFTQSN